MKFNHLKASIMNNADQTPTLFLTLCMVESLFLDVEDSCGTEISRCPAGDERLPSKLVWLCRFINDTYRENSGDFQRGRARLDAAMGKLEDTQKKLDDFSAVAEQLAAMEAEFSTLDQKLRDQSAAAEECRRLDAKCDQAKQKLEALSRFDPAAAKAELEKLSHDIAKQESAKAALLAQLTQTKQSYEELRQENVRLQTEAKSVQEKTSALKETLCQDKRAFAQAKEDLSSLEASYEALREEGNQLREKQQETKDKIAKLREAIYEFQNKVLMPDQAVLDEAQKELANLQAGRSRAAQELDRLKSERNALILDISRQKAENESLSERLTRSRKNLDVQQLEKKRLDGDLSDCLQKLEALQTEVEQLNGEQLPEARELLQREQQRQKELSQSVEQLQSQSIMLQSKNEEQTARLQRLEADVKKKNNVYDALTASCAASSEELTRLEQQIAELRNNNDEKKLEIYRNQLESNQRKLEEIQQDCSRIEQENARAEKELEDGEIRRDRLLERKRQHESGIKDMEKLLRELKFAGTEEYVHEVDSLKERVEELERVRGKLSASIDKIHEILGDLPTDRNASLEERMKQELQDLGLRIGVLRDTLVDCAKRVKMEER